MPVLIEPSDGEQRKAPTGGDGVGVGWLVLPPQAAAPQTPSPQTKHKRVESSAAVHQELLVQAQSTPSPPRKAMVVGHTLPLFIASVGNPGAQYANTLHSAGHTVLNRLAARLGYGAFQKDKDFAKGLISTPPTLYSNDHGSWTLWQSPSYMNESGKSVRAAYLRWAKSLPDEGGRLVIVHDELEKPLGAVSLRTAQGASAKGHNGLKSIMALIGNTPFARIGVGIGRPVSRDSADVASYVLRKMTSGEKDAIEASIDNVIRRLREIEKG